MATARRRHHRRRHGAVQPGRARAIAQLLLAATALVVLLVAWSRIADGAAGCFGAMATDPRRAPDDAAPSSDHDAPSRRGIRGVRLLPPEGALE